MRAGAHLNTEAGAVSSEHQVNDAADTPILEVVQNDAVPFSGFTGPSADSILAKEVVEQTLEESPVALKDENLTAALRSLEQIVGRMKADAAEPSLAPLGTMELSPTKDAHLPMWDEVSRLLERAQGKKYQSFVSRILLNI